ncbi:ricin-type beta-trefoil lectin domain protein [Streptosporangiaceae bacterium NEAU-GS5]|nr:ricin-type beta-trefoil lectin domain protein [Streptosporangiaceae bacterium NEAU-GS5]
MRIQHRTLLALLLGAVMVFAVGFTPESANAATWFPIISHNGKCVDERKQDPNLHAKIQLWDCHYPNGTLVPEQTWRADFVKNYNYHGENWRVFQVVNKRTGLCLEIPDSVPSTAPDRTQADLFTCDANRASQLWWMPVANGLVGLVNINSVKCLDVRGNDDDDGTVVQQYRCNGTYAQEFYIFGFTG